jgi:hypothetical protein
MAHFQSNSPFYNPNIGTGLTSTPMRGVNSYNDKPYNRYEVQDEPPIPNRSQVHNNELSFAKPS